MGQTSPACFYQNQGAQTSSGSQKELHHVLVAADNRASHACDSDC